MQIQLHSNNGVTPDGLKQEGYDEVRTLTAAFLARNVTFLGTTIEAFRTKAAEAQAYKAAGYPTPLDSDVYPYISDQMAICACTAQQAADVILADLTALNTIERHTERARLTAVNHISLEGALQNVAREIFAWRHSFGLPSTMGATLNKPYVTPAPDPTYPTVDVLGNGADQLIITLPEKSLGDDMEVVVSSYAPPGDPWRGAYSATYTNPGPTLALTFTDSTDPAHASSDMKWLVTIRNMPRVPQFFVVNSTTA